MSCTCKNKIHILSFFHALLVLYNRKLISMLSSEENINDLCLLYINFLRDPKKKVLAFPPNSHLTPYDAVELLLRPLFVVCHYYCYSPAGSS